MTSNYKSLSKKLIRSSKPKNSKKMLKKIKYKAKSNRKQFSLAGKNSSKRAGSLLRENPFSRFRKKEQTDKKSLAVSLSKIKKKREPKGQSNSTKSKLSQSLDTSSNVINKFKSLKNFEIPNPVFELDSFTSKTRYFKPEDFSYRTRFKISRKSIQAGGVASLGTGNLPTKKFSFFKRNCKHESSRISHENTLGRETKKIKHKKINSLHHAKRVPSNLSSFASSKKVKFISDIYY